MPLPQQVLERLGQEPPRTPGWSGQLLMFSGTVFFVSIIAYLGLAFGYKPYLNSEARKLQGQVQSLGQQIPLERQTKIIGFYSQLANLKSLLAGHVYSSKMLEWLEKNTQVNVYYSKFSLNAQNNQLTIGGVAKTADDLYQQVAIFQGKPEVKKMNLGGISISQNGQWQFDISLFFEPGFFSRFGGVPK